MSKLIAIQLFKNSKTFVDQSGNELYAIVNTTFTKTYFHTGRSIAEYEQQGSNRAAYTKEALINYQLNQMKY